MELNLKLKYRNLMTKITLDNQLKASIASIKLLVKKGELSFSPEFLKKVGEIKERLEKDLVPIITTDNLARLRKTGKNKTKHTIRVKT